MAPYPILMRVTRATLGMTPHAGAEPPTHKVTPAEIIMWRKNRCLLYERQHIDTGDTFIAFRVALQLRSKGYRATADQTTVHTNASTGTLRRYIHKEKNR